MKRIWVAISLLIISGIICTVEYSLIIRECDNYTNIIQSADNYVENENYDKAVKECTNAENRFAKSDCIMNVFLIHSDVDDVTNNISMLKKYAENKNKTAFLSLSAKTKRQLLSLKKSELPIFENIM